MAKYHTLIERNEDSKDNVWVIGFGDRDLECVQFEKQDRRDHGAKAKDLRIITQPRAPSLAQYEELKAMVAAMNAAPVAAQ